MVSIYCVNTKERLPLRRKSKQYFNGTPHMNNYLIRGSQNQHSTTVSKLRDKTYKSQQFKYPGHHFLPNLSGYEHLNTEKVVSNPSGYEHLNTEKVVSNPSGYEHLNTEKVVSDNPGEEFVCPDGYRKHTRAGVEYCSPTQTEDEIARIKERGCPGGADCVHSAGLQDAPCIAGTHLISTITGRKCVTNTLSVNKSINRQSTDRKPEATLNKEAADMPECDDGKVAALSQDGYICLDPVFPLSVCPEDLVPSWSPRGIRCVPCPRGQRVIRSGDDAKCDDIVVTTDAPCPEGLEPRQTPVGRVCRYIPPPNMRVIPMCPQGTTLRRVGGKKVCVDDSICPAGHVNSEHGCALPSKLDGSYCIEGEVNYKGSCIPIHLAGQFQKDTSNPCVPGQVLVVTRSGSACQPMTDYRVAGSQHSMHCGTGTILQQTLTGFHCLHGYLPVYIVPMCELGFVIAKLGEMYECVSRLVVDLLCAGDEQIVKTHVGFVCSRVVTEGDCHPEEFRYTDREDRTICISQNHASSDCDGSMNHATLCLNQTPHCQQGYKLNLDSDVAHCILEMDHGFDVTEADSTQPCDADGTVRPCDIPTEILLSGCNPDCANGGTCVNDSCICPPGVSGYACHIDLDECEGRPCEYGCENLFGSYHCTCPYGRTLRIDGHTCEDVGCFPECLNKGMCRRGRCACSSGYEGTYCQTDKDECSVYGGRLCEYRCRNTNGGYQCICPPGSRLNQDGRTCLNTTCIPECRNGGLCRNHRCHCPRAFYGLICQFDINECRTQRPCDQTCHNTRGSFVCSCGDGFTLHTDGRTCVSA